MFLSYRQRLQVSREGNRYGCTDDEATLASMKASEHQMLLPRPMDCRQVRCDGVHVPDARSTVPYLNAPHTAAIVDPTAPHQRKHFFICLILAFAPFSSSPLCYCQTALRLDLNTVLGLVLVLANLRFDSPVLVVAATASVILLVVRTVVGYLNARVS